jgi:hypothetical protein
MVQRCKALNKTGWEKSKEDDNNRKPISTDGTKERVL